MGSAGLSRALRMSCRSCAEALCGPAGRAMEGHCSKVDFCAAPSFGFGASGSSLLAPPLDLGAELAGNLARQHDAAGLLRRRQVDTLRPAQDPRGPVRLVAPARKLIASQILLLVLERKEAHARSVGFRRWVRRDPGAILVVDEIAEGLLAAIDAVG